MKLMVFREQTCTYFFVHKQTSEHAKQEAVLLDVWFLPPKQIYALLVGEIVHMKKITVQI